VLLFGFIMLVLGVPLTIAGNWQLMRSAVRWVHRVRSEHQHRNEPVSIAAGATGVTMQQAMEIARREYGKFHETPTSPFIPSSPRVMLRPGYSHNGGEVSTGSVADLDGYMESMISQPQPSTLSLKSGRWTAGTTAGAAGTTDAA
jgi:hypothetical protein